MSEALHIKHEGDTWIFTFNRAAKMNALNAEMVEEIIQGIDHAHASGARLLMFIGAGKNFCAGFDFANIDSQSDGDLLLRFVRIETLLHMVASSPCLTVAYAHGKTFGAGVDLFVVCKKRYCAPDASFRMPGLKFGLVLGSRRFCELVGREVALDVLQEAKTITALEAQAIGLLHGIKECTEWPNLETEAQRIARALPHHTQKHLFQVLDLTVPDRDMANLVRSAAYPSLKKRLSEYFAQHR